MCEAAWLSQGIPTQPSAGQDKSRSKAPNQPQCTLHPEGLGFTAKPLPLLCPSQLGILPLFYLN